MQVKNISRPGKAPDEGDIVEITHDGGAIERKAFYPPVEAVPGPEPVPQIVSRFQARAAMLAAPATSADFPNLLAQINAAVDGSDNAFVQLAWAEAVEWSRASPTVNALAEAVGVTSEQLDDLFRAAAGIAA